MLVAGSNVRIGHQRLVTNTSDLSPTSDCFHHQKLLIHTYQNIPNIPQFIFVRNQTQNRTNPDTRLPQNSCRNPAAGETYPWPKSIEHVIELNWRKWIFILLTIKRWIWLLFFEYAALCSDDITADRKWLILMTSFNQDQNERTRWSRSYKNSRFDELQSFTWTNFRSILNDFRFTKLVIRIWFSRNVPFTDGHVTLKRLPGTLKLQL